MVVTSYLLRVLFCLPVNYIHAVLWSPCHCPLPMSFPSCFLFLVCTLFAYFCLCGNNKGGICLQPSWLALFCSSLVLVASMNYHGHGSLKPFFCQDGCDYWQEEEGANVQTLLPISLSQMMWVFVEVVLHTTKIGKSHHDFLCVRQTTTLESQPDVLSFSC